MQYIILSYISNLILQKRHYVQGNSDIEYKHSLEIYRILFYTKNVLEYSNIYSTLIWK